MIIITSTGVLLPTSIGDNGKGEFKAGNELLDLPDGERFRREIIIFNFW